MAETVVPARGNRGRWVVIIGLILVVIVVVVLLLLRGCHPAVVTEGPFDYFKAKDAELNNDPVKILAYVRDTMPTLEYRGDVKGALGALWNGAASAEEKKVLAEALLSAAGAARTVTLDEVSAGRDKALDALPALKLMIVHRAVMAGTGAPVATTVYDGQAGALVGDVHSMEVTAAGERKFTWRAGGAGSKTVEVPEDAVGEELVFTWRVPGQAAKAAALTSTRELWRRENRMGPQRATVGDRHELVVLPCAIGAYVREKEELLLKQRGREKAIEAAAYLVLLDYARASDGQLVAQEKQMQVTARRDQPRVLVWSRYVAPELPGGTASAIDLRLNGVGFSGDKTTVYQAAQVRSFLESAQAQQFLERRSGLPARATFGMFTMLRDDAPDNVGRRLMQIRGALNSLALERSEANSATFSVQAGKFVSDAQLPTVQARWMQAGFEVRTGPIVKEVAARLAQEKGAVVVPSAGTVVFKDVDEAAVAIETALLAADFSPAVLPEFALAISIDRKGMSLVQKESRFGLKWEEEGRATDQQNRVLRVGDGLDYQWRIQAGVLPVAGTRQVLARAMAESTVHNPWYKAGSSQQDDATSFVFSRKVYSAIKGGQSVEMTMEGRYGPKKADAAATRPVEFKAALTPTGTGTIDASVNGKAEKLSVLQCTLRGKPLAVLDDAISPVGLADQIKSVVTVARGRLVDAKNVAVGGATVRVFSKARLTVSPVAESPEPSAPDGMFQLPPPVEEENYGKAILQVTFRDKTSQRVEVDFSAVGSSVVTVKVERPQAKLLYLSLYDRRQLEALAVSESVKRQARRDLEAGMTVVIPSQYVSDGMRDFIGYYACNNATGDYAGVTEEGLCGATNWVDAAVVPATAPATPETMPDIESVATTQTTQPSEPAEREVTVDEPVAEVDASQAYRKAMIAWRANAAARPQAERDASPETLQAMRRWAEATDIAGLYGVVPAVQLPTKMAELLKANRIQLGGAAAKPAIQLGYVETTQYLAQKVEGRDGK